MPIATVGLKPKSRTSIGVISEPPPIPVSPTRSPIASPVSDSCQVIERWTTMPAPTVSFVASSTRTKAPVVRFSGYGSTASGSESRSVTSARSLSSSRSGAGTSREGLHVDPRAELVHDRARPPARVLHREPGPGLERALAHPADPRDELAGGNGGSVRVGEHVAAGDVEVVLEPDHDGHRRHRLVERAVGGLDVRHARAPARGQDDDLVAHAPRPARDLARVAAVVVVVGRHRPDHPLHREAAVGEVPVAGELDRLEVAEQRRPVVPGRGIAGSRRRSPRSAPRAGRRGGRRSRPARRASAAPPRSRGSATPTSRRGPSC